MEVEKCKKKKDKKISKKKPPDSAISSTNKPDEKCEEQTVSDMADDIVQLDEEQNSSCSKPTMPLLIGNEQNSKTTDLMPDTEQPVLLQTVKKGEYTEQTMKLTDEKIEKANTSKPFEMENMYEKLLNENKIIVNEITLHELNNVAQNKSKTNTRTDVMRAYTEAQLSALYTNTELDFLEGFTSQFVEAELKGVAMKQHPLYELLSKYLQVREKLSGNTLELEQIRKEYRDLQIQIWSVDTAVVSERGQCQDGNVVTASHSYNKATFHRTVFQSVVRILGKIRKLTNENHVLFSYMAEDLRLQIELYLQTTISNCMNASQLQRNCSVSLSMQEEPVTLKPFLSEVRLCISVLFSFQRNINRDVQFTKETRNWLNQLIAVLLRLASYQDHLFILNHVLRCPPNVGSWASCYIQAPISERLQESPFASYEINHIIAVLALILMPVQKREQFLENFLQTKETAGEAPWVMVDSEGEEDENTSGTSLRENDLVALLNQLPLDNLFRSILLVNKRNDEDIYDYSQVSEHHILRFLAFCTVLLNIFRSGLKTYDQPRYNQFCKRMSRFVRHIVQYATDQWELFQKYQRLDDLSMLKRLQVEYDAFFLRATYCLYSSQKLGAWQFLAVVPYELVTIKSLWKIFYFLHDSDSSAELILNPTDDTDYSKKFWDPVLRVQFEEKLSNLADAESYYLLNTFANMALARDVHDMDFIYTATMDLLQIGFVSESMQETCSKSARILLTHITSKHPHLLSDIFKTVKENLNKIGLYSLYLYEELPLSIWKLTENDLEIISRLLLNHSVMDNESRLARMILSRLNWDLTNDIKLFLPHSLHCKVALLIVECTEQEPGYLNWAWQMLLRLRLHISDKGLSDFNKINEIEHYNVLSKGIREQQPLASFVCILMTSWGHLVPLICTKGLAQLQFLQTHQKHEAVIFALHLIVPLFINCQESIINCDSFQNVLMGIVNADRGYINMAKSLIITQNTVLQQFGNMIENQIVNYAWYDLQSPRCLVRLWMNSLVSIPSWNTDYGVLYLLDVIIRAAFFHSDSLDVASSILKDLLQCTTPQEQKSSIVSLIKWVAQNNPPPGSLMAGYLSSCTWLAYVMISLEFEERERKPGLWNEILLQLQTQKGKINVDVAIKKAASNCKVPSFTSASLCIYRWAQQALDTPVDHVLLPLLWQKFFSLYLTRTPASSAINKCCIGDKFFEGMVNFTFLKRLKKRLQETIDYYVEKVDECETDKTMYENCLRLFRAYNLWLEEPRLQEANLFLPGLPPLYQPQLLALIIQGNTAPWLEYLDYNRIKLEQQNCTKLWRMMIHREKSNVNQPLPNAGGGVESKDPVERILRRLTSYDTPKPPPVLKNVAPIIPPVNLSDKTTMFNTLEPCFKTLQQFAHNHNISVSEQKTLDCTYIDLIPQLYRSVLNKIRKQVPCKGRNQAVHCSGTAVITLEMQETRINERIELQIETNRNNYDTILAKLLQAPANSICRASVTLQQSIKILQAQKSCNLETSELGVELFYYILSLINEENSNYLPTKKLFSVCIEKLGKSHICGVEYEMPRLLNKILEDPNLGGFLAPYFSPTNISTSNLLFMYQTITNEINQKYDVLFALLSKFDINNWLSAKKPKLSQRLQFIETVVKALTTLGFELPIECLALHEVYRKHLLCVFEHQFPEHYGEVLLSLLKASNGNEAGCISLIVWMDVLNSLSRPLELKLNVPMREQVRRYAQIQHTLQHQEILDTSVLLARHFTNERLQYGLYGLYPKCRNYIDVLVLLIGMTGHSLIISSLNTHQGELGDKLCGIIWPFLREMFAPWIVPYSMHNLKENMASWIQQLADDRSVLLPWIPADGPFAVKVVQMFFECIQFIIHTLPACSNILSFVWQWYVTSFAHTAVKDHILNPIHASFLALPWHNFWPSVIDLEYMLKVAEQYLPECHIFLGHVFISVMWPNWLKNLHENTPLQIQERVHHCLLNLLVKLSNEPNIRANHTEKAKTLLVQAENFDWAIIDPNLYQQIMDWYVMSYDPLVLFKSDPLDLDYRVLHLLQVVSCYHKSLTEELPDLLQKRHIFVRSYTKLFSVFTSRYKSMVQNKEFELNSVICKQLNHMECVVCNDDELTVILSELLCVLNNSGICKVGVKCFGQWISSKNGDSPVIRAVLHSVGTVIGDSETVAALYEITLNSYFQNSNVTGAANESNWNDATDLVNVYPPKRTELEQVAVKNGNILTLHALLLQQIKNSQNIESLLNNCLDWLSNIKISDSAESKLPLMWSSVLSLSSKLCEQNEVGAGTILNKFSQILVQLSGEKGATSWGKGILGAIGIGKQSSASLNFRFLCRALAGYVLAQLPDTKGKTQTVRNIPNAPSMVGQSGGNSECVKILLVLDFGQSQGKIKECAELALKQIQDPGNSLHNANTFLALILRQLFTKPYLKDIA